MGQIAAQLIPFNEISAVRGRGCPGRIHSQQWRNFSALVESLDFPVIGSQSQI